MTNTNSITDVEIFKGNQMKQTAANNPFLAGVKKHMNSKIYAHALRIFQADGQPATLQYLQQFFSKPVTAEFFETFQRSNEGRSGYFASRPGETFTPPHTVQ